MGLTYFNGNISRDAVELIAAPQDFTVGWVNLGPAFPTLGYNTAALFLTVDINNTQNARFRLVGNKTGSDTTNYPLPILDVSATVVGAEPSFIELTTDVDQSMILGFQVDNAVPWAQFQIQCSAVGASAGNVSSASYTLGSR